MQGLFFPARKATEFFREARRWLPVVALLSSCTTHAGGNLSAEDAFAESLAQTLDGLDDVSPYAPPDVAIEDPEALAPFREALRMAASRQGQARVVIYGGSHTAADLYPSVIRRAFQAGFGNLGHGFVMPVPPFENYWQGGVRIEPSEGFAGTEPSLKRMGVDSYGIAGMAFDSEDVSTAELSTDNSSASHIELLFLTQPGAGSVDLRVDDFPAWNVPTQATEMRAASVVIGVTDGPHRLRIDTRGDGPVRLYGVVLEREGSGVVVDQLGLAGAKARHPLLWTESVWYDLLASRRPNLFIFSYGNNETDDSHLTSDQHVAHFEAMLTRFRTHFPTSACLVVSPSDRLLPDANGVLVTPPLITILRDAQRRVAHEQGCAFFDSLAWQGGPGAMARWRDQSPPLARQDGIHFTELGYRLFGAQLVRSLVAAVSEPPSQAPEPHGG